MYGLVKTKSAQKLYNLTLGCGVACPTVTQSNKLHHLRRFLCWHQFSFIIHQYACLVVLQFIQLTDPTLIAEALRSRELDKRRMAGGGLNGFASPHGLDTLLTSPTNERWKAVRCGNGPLYCCCWKITGLVRC